MVGKPTLIALVLAAVFLSGQPAEAQSNNAPVFDPATVTLSVPENTPAGTNIGDPVTATDADNDTLTYTLGGDDAASFDIVSTTGQIRTYLALDHEGKSSYTVSVTASDGNGGTDEATVNISVTNVIEPIPTPAAPSVSVTQGDPSRVFVSWTAPAHTGSALSYDLRYQKPGVGGWTNGPKGVVGLSETIYGLFEVVGDILYEVQVRAKSDEFISGWSSSGTTTGPGYNQLPTRTRPGVNHDPRCNLPETTTLGAPDGVEVEATATQVALSWQPYRFGVGSVMSGYCIWRAENSLEFRLLGFVPAQDGGPGPERYVDGDVLPSSEYSYLVRTVDFQGVSRWPGRAWALTGTELPGLSASATRSSVTLSWDDPEDDAITGYRILRRVNWGTETTLAQGVSAAATTYVDRRVSPDTAYAYRVQVLRGTEAGYPSPWVTALTLPRSSGSSTSVSEPANQDLPADTGTTGLLKLDESVTGVIESVWEEDWFAVDLTAGETYFFRLRYDGEARHGNGWLVLGEMHDADGVRVDWRSFLVPCCNHQSSSVFIPNRTGRHYLPVAAYNYQVVVYSGVPDPLPLAYTLELHSDQIADHIGRQSALVGTGQAEVGEWTSGEFHDLDTSDDYRVELCGGRRYRIPLFYNVLTADADGVMRRPHLADGVHGYQYTEPYVLYAPHTGLYQLSIYREPGDEPDAVWEAPDNRLERDSKVFGEATYRFYVEPLDQSEDLSGLQAISEASGSDLPANTGTAGLLPYDQAVTGSIDTAGDVDWFAVRFDERKCNRTYWFDLKGADTGDGTLEDPYIVGLYDALGQFIPYNSYPGAWDTPDDDSGVGRNARQAYVPSTPGVYYVAVRANGTGTGTYSLSLRDVTDTSTSEEAGVSYDTWSNIGSDPDNHYGNLAAGIPATGLIEREEVGTSDMWHLNVQSGRRYRLQVEGGPFAPYPRFGLWPVSLPLTDSDVEGIWLHLVADDVTNIRTFEFQRTPYAVASDHLGPSEKLRYEETAWYAYVDSIFPNSSPHETDGGYTVLLTDITDTEDQSELGGQHTTGTVAVGGSVTGTLDVKGDVDWFEVDLQVGRTYRFRMKGAGYGVGTLADPYMKLHQSTDFRIHTDLVSSLTTERATNNDTCARSKDSVLTFTVPVSTGFGISGKGPYWVEANTPGDGTGTYTIEVQEYDGANTPATGAPTITGTPQAGETLTAGTAAMCDADGMGNVSKTGAFGQLIVEETLFTYQWLADGTAISGATEATYALADADVGKTISVTVSFTDNAGHSESLTSETTAAVTAAQNAPGNNPATGAPTISGTAQVGETLTAGASGINDPDGLEDATFSYQWLADGSEIAGATGQTYTVGDGYVGGVLSVRVTFTDDAGNEESLTSEPTEAVVAAGLALESAKVDGATLTLTFSELLNILVDLPETAFTVTVEGTSRTVSDSSVSGSAVTLTLATAVVAGEAVTVGYEKPEGNSIIGDLRGRSAESFSGREVTNETAPPPLTASAGTVPASHDGNSTFTFQLLFSEEPHEDSSYVTLRDHAFTVTGGSIENASRLTPGSNQGWEITVQPSGNGSVTVVLPPTTDCEAEGAICTGDGRKLSNRVEVSIPGTGSQQEEQQNNPATGAPTISGTAQVGQTLTVSTTGIADADGLTNATFSYQWLADDAAISGATGSSYTLVSGDRGKAIKARVSFTDDAGNAETLTSAATATVTAANNPATGTPTISGTAQVGETLSVSTTGIADADGLTNATFTYQWLADDAAISGAMGSTYTLVSGDRGKAIRVTVSFTDDAGNAETLTSAATAAVAPPPLTASASQVPASHAGSSTFTFQLLFSEEPHEDFSYVTMRDHAFTVTGGSIQNARRLNPPSNLGWEITVQPSGNGTVTVVLPPTTDCEATGAVCTGDGRKLSNRVEFTVSGPG